MKPTACPLLAAAAAAVLLYAAVPPSALAHDREQGNSRGAKNVIFMVPDGMGLADVTAARIYKNGIDGEPLHFETLDHIGYQRTYSANSTITDSAPAASAWACGEKFNNGEICLHGNGRPHLPSILELAKRTGRGTGLVATSTITHATPAAFGAHVVNRNCETEIARQYIEVTRPDVLLGGGAVKFNPAKPDACGATGDYVSKAEQSGYTVVQTRQEMKESAAAGAWKVLGLFTPEGMTPEVLRTSGTTEPRLPEMTVAALDILERSRNGRVRHQWSGGPHSPLRRICHGRLDDQGPHGNRRPGLGAGAGERRGRPGSQQHGSLQGDEAGAEGRQLTQETGTSATLG